MSEAPRGTLIHHYRIDDNGLICWANLIVATGHNNGAMNRGVRQTAERFVNGKRLTEGALNRVEALIRCYDPCLSCSTHAWGRCPWSCSWSMRRGACWTSGGVSPERATGNRGEEMRKEQACKKQTSQPCGQRGGRGDRLVPRPDGRSPQHPRGVAERHPQRYLPAETLQAVAAKTGIAPPRS